MDPERLSAIRDVKQKIVRSQDLFRSLSIILLYAAGSFLFLILFQISAARYLGPVDYSVLGVFASILFTIILMSSSIYLIITRFITYHHTRYQYEQINYLVTTSLRYIFASGFVIFLLCFIFEQQIAAFFNINHLGPITALGFAIWLQLLVPIYEAAFKGLENLHAMGRLRLVESLARLCLLLILAYFGLHITAMIFALGAGTFVALSFSYVPIRQLQHLHPVKPNMQEIWDYAKPAIITVCAIALLLNLDVILVKHLFPADQAGIYAASSWFAKVPFIVSVSIGNIIFPRATKLHVDGLPSAHLLRTGLKWLSGVVIANTLLAIFFSGPLLHSIFNRSVIPTSYMGPYAFAMGLLAIVNLLSVYQLALKRFTLATTIPWFFVAECILLYFFHTTIFQIVVVTVFVTSLLVAATLYLLRGELQLDYLFNE